MYSARVGAALAYAADGHAQQPRKGKPDEAYLSHLLQATAMVVRYGGSEDQMIGAALHDLAEDQGGEARLAQIEELFGPTVAGMVADCSDAFAEPGAAKPPWRERKARHLAHMRVMAPESVLVSVADKIANLTDLVDDLERDGDAALAGFNSSPDQMRAYYTAADAVLAPRLGEIPYIKAERAARHLRGLLAAFGSRVLPPGEDAVGWFLVATGAAPGVAP